MARLKATTALVLLLIGLWLVGSALQLVSLLADLSTLVVLLAVVGVLAVVVGVGASRPRWLSNPYW